MSVLGDEALAKLVLPLVWHKSHMPSWNGDYHVTSPFIYSVRCADENGWKWASNGTHGYSESPESAKRDAEVYHRDRVVQSINAAEVLALRKRVEAADALVSILGNVAMFPKDRNAATQAAIAAYHTTGAKP